MLSNHVRNVFKTRASRDMGCRFLSELLELEVLPTTPINCMNMCPLPYVNPKQFGVYCVCCPPGGRCTLWLQTKLFILSRALFVAVICVWWCTPRYCINSRRYSHFVKLYEFAQERQRQREIIPKEKKGKDLMIVGS